MELKRRTSITLITGRPDCVVHEQRAPPGHRVCGSNHSKGPVLSGRKGIGVDLMCQAAAYRWVFEREDALRQLKSLERHEQTQARQESQCQGESRAPGGRPRLQCVGWAEQKHGGREWPTARAPNCGSRDTGTAGKEILYKEKRRCPVQP